MHRLRGRIWISAALIAGVLAVEGAPGAARPERPLPAASLRLARLTHRPGGRTGPLRRPARPAGAGSASRVADSPPAPSGAMRSQAHAALAADPRSAPIILAQVQDEPYGQPMPPGFVGVSIEYPALHLYTGRDPTRVDPVMVALLRNLAPGQRPVLRIGGNSADSSWYPQRGVIQPGGVNYALSPDWVDTAAHLARTLAARLILGINLAGDRPDLAGLEARTLLHGIERSYLEALEIGNEPDLYGQGAWYRDGEGRWIYARTSGYDLSAFIGDFDRWRATLPAVPLVGPSVAELTWLSDLGSFISAARPLRMITIHRYPLRGCSTPPSSPLYATIPSLLADSSSEGLAQQVSGFASQTHAAGLPFRIDEMNSVACKGKWGVSDTFASALWALDTLYNLAAVGVDGTNFHMLPGAAYELFSPSQRSGRWQAFVRPEYYGLLMFAHAFPPRSRLLQVSVPGGDSGPVKVYATRAADGHYRVMMINKDPSNAVTVQVQIQYAGNGTAAVERLEAPSVSSTRNVTLDGQSFGNSTRTGELEGPRIIQTITPYAGSYYVSLPAGSAALLIH